MSGHSFLSNISAKQATELEEFMQYFGKEHPLAKQGFTRFKLLLQNDDYHLYQVYQNKTPYFVKVLCDPDLFCTELTCLRKLGLHQSNDDSSSQNGEMNISLKMKDYFHFRTMLKDDGSN